jgi:hypothetical protein
MEFSVLSFMFLNGLLYLFQKLLHSGHTGSYLHCGCNLCNNASHEHLQWESSTAGNS